MYKSFVEIKEAINDGRKVEDIVRYYLGNIKKKKNLNAFIEVYEEEALRSARTVDEKLSKGSAGRLAGMIIGLKDNICYKDHKVSAASKMLEGYESIYSATVVERLLVEDAIIIGRLNCDEFAMGSSNETSNYGSTKNPINEEYVPGGSSGGSASAVAGNLCTASIGTDTGGSIRQPASFTGTIGFKPTYGRVSRYGAIAYASSFDQISPIANNINDIALILEVISGKDEFDSTVSSKEVPDMTIRPLNEKLRVAVVKEVMENDALDQEIKTRMEEIIAILTSNGHEVERVSFDFLEQLVPAYYVLTTAEASSNLSRFDGIHYGYRSKEAVSVEDTYIKSRTEGFGTEVKRRIMTGTFVLSQGQYDAYYSQAQKVRRIIRDKTNSLLERFDVFLLPTTSSTAFKIGEIKDPIKLYLQDLFTVQANLAGNPAISLPLGQHSNKMPFGIQLIGKYFKEDELLNISAHLLKLVKNE